VKPNYGKQGTTPTSAPSPHWTFAPIAKCPNGKFLAQCRISGDYKLATSFPRVSKSRPFAGTAVSLLPCGESVLEAHRIFPSGRRHRSSRTRDLARRALNPS
jgi:hypothetical protein